MLTVSQANEMLLKTHYCNLNREPIILVTSLSYGLFHSSLNIIALQYALHYKV